MEEQEGMGRFTISLGGTKRAAYPPNDSASLSELRFEVSFSKNGTLAKKFSVDGSDTITGSIEYGTYDVTLEIYLIADDSLFAEGEAKTNPVTIGEANNTIPVDAYKSVTVSPDSATVTIGGPAQQFTAAVYIDPSPSITWSVTNSNGSPTSYSTISSTGVLTVTAAETAAALTVTASYSSDPIRKGSAEVTLTDKVVAIGPSLSGPDTTPQSYSVGATATALSVSVTNASAISAQPGGTLTYQWYKNNANDTTSGTAISAANGTSYTPLTSASEAGITYYYVEVTNTITDNGDSGAKTATSTSDVATVLVTTALTLTVSATPSITLTPIEATTPTAYTERKGSFTVEVDGFITDSDASNVELSITTVTGLSFSGYNSTNAAASGKKTFSIEATYDGNGVFATTAATITINILGSSIPAKYTYDTSATGNKTRSITILDGQDSGISPDRRIPVNAANIEAFNMYANTYGLSLHYKLVGTAGSPISAPSSWVPIGSFYGSFDGQGNTINLSININPATSYGGCVGLFDDIGDSGIVKNLALTGTVTCTDNSIGNIGSLAGFNRGTIENCSSSVNVTGAKYVGGLVGNNTGTITNCYTTGDVTSSGTYQPTGGIAGYSSADWYGNGGIIENCYSTGIITSSNWAYAGGIVGQSAGTVSNCVALNSHIIADSGPSCRIVGDNNGGTLTNNYASDQVPVKLGTSPDDYRTGNTSSDPDGADIPSTQETVENWWKNVSGLTWTWGSSSSAPWKWSTSQSRPVMWFEP